MDSETTAVFQLPIHKGGMMMLLFSHLLLTLSSQRFRSLGSRLFMQHFTENFGPIRMRHEASAECKCRQDNNRKFNQIHEISKVSPISELTLTKHNRKELLENLLVLHLGFVAELGLAASLCS